MSPASGYLGLSLWYRRGEAGDRVVCTQDRGRDCIQGEALTAAEGEERQYWEGRDG